MSNSRITADEAHHLLGDGTAVLVDVREPDEFAAGHAPGALHLPPVPAGRRHGRPPGRA